VILLALARGATSVEEIFPIAALSVVETVAFILFIVVGLTGVIFGAGFLGNPASAAEVIAVPRVGFILVLNIVIGVKVGAGVSLICVHLLEDE
jgi:multicomponent Na+:H+ antiporter subunit B